MDFSVNGNTEPTVFPVIAFTHWKHLGHRAMYVADEAHGTKGRCDWEYSEKSTKPLSEYWWRRFRSDMHKAGNCAHWSLAPKSC